MSNVENTNTKRPKLDLKTYMTRQNTAFFTDAEWPDPATMDKPVNYVLRRDGLWEVRKTRGGIFRVRREKFSSPLPGFPEDKAEEGGEPIFGKIPVVLYKEIIAFFKAICDDSKDEAYVQTFWDPQNNHYYNFVPTQRVSGASVNFERDTDRERDHVLVLETHSHNTMGAFFSGTDNNDEKSDRFFGVVGKLNTLNPEVLFSFVCGGERKIIPLSSVFDFHDEVTPFPSEWRDKIKKYQAQDFKKSNQSEYRKEHSGFSGYHNGFYYENVDDIIDSAMEEAKNSMGGGSNNRPFSTAVSQSLGEDRIETAVAQAMHAINEEKYMTSAKATKIFEALVSLMTADDVKDLVRVMIDSGYESVVSEQLTEPADTAWDNVEITE